MAMKNNFWKILIRLFGCLLWIPAMLVIILLTPFIFAATCLGAAGYYIITGNAGDFIIQNTLTALFEFPPKLIQ